MAKEMTAEEICSYTGLVREYSMLFLRTGGRWSPETGARMEKLREQITKMKAR